MGSLKSTPGSPIEQGRGLGTAYPVRIRGLAARKESKYIKVEDQEFHPTLRARLWWDLAS